ncbi:MAG TPA: TadE/TadG family type IV pilus assembly protein [Hyphomicrobiaceae bacterium]|nr:TadE/TadG family type IV pilus assembly protein [Hyphomicrobiaceae bacterium]
MRNLVTRFSAWRHDGRRRGILARLRRDTKGMAAVEFGMIVPIMFFLFVGTIEFSQALTVDRRLTLAASSTADLIARAPNSGLTPEQVDRDLKIVEQLILPYDIQRLYVKVLSVIAQGTPGNPSVLIYTIDWSRDSNAGTPHPRGEEYHDIPEGLLVAGESVIVSEARYNYTPLIFNYFIKSAFNMTERFFLKPRNSSCVHLRPINCVTGGEMS